MRNFNLGALRTWQQVAVGELIAFDVPEGGQRTVTFEVLSDGPVSIRAVAGEDAWLVGHGEALMNVRFVVDEPVGVVFLGDANIDVFIRTHDETQVVPESLDPTFTTFDPRPSGPSDEVKRMMQLMKLNQLRNQQQLDAERQRIQAQFADLMRQTQAGAAAPPRSEPSEPSGEVPDAS